MIQFNCPQCKTLLATKDEYVGMRVSCNKCHAVVVVPGVEITEEKPIVCEFCGEINSPSAKVCEHCEEKLVESKVKKAQKQTPFVQTAPDKEYNGDEQQGRKRRMPWILYPVFCLVALGIFLVVYLICDSGKRAEMITVDNNKKPEEIIFAYYDGINKGNVQQIDQLLLKAKYDKKAIIESLFENIKKEVTNDLNIRIGKTIIVEKAAVVKVYFFVDKHERHKTHYLYNHNNEWKILPFDYTSSDRDEYKNIGIEDDILDACEKVFQQLKLSNQKEFEDSQKNNKD